MYKILYSVKSLESLENFRDYLENYYIDKYYDSWIYNADDIILAHIQKLSVFMEELRKYINFELSSWMLWVVEKEEAKQERRKLTLKIQSYMVSIKFTQYKNKKEIQIEELQIDT